MEPDYNPDAPEGALETSPELTALGVEGVVNSLPNIAGFVPNITNSFAGIADSVPNVAILVPNIADSLPNITRSFPNIVNSLPNITNTFPDIDGSKLDIANSMPNITNFSPNIAGSFPNITKSFPIPVNVLLNITNSFPNITSIFGNIADNSDNAVVADVGQLDVVTSQTKTSSSSPGLMNNALTTALPGFTNVFQNGSTSIFSTMSTLNSSVLPVPKFNSTTLAPTKEPIKKMNTLWQNVTTAPYNGTVPGANDTPEYSICGSDYTVDECDWVVNFERILSPILMILIIIGIVANLYIVYTVIVRKDMRTFSNLFMTNLSVTHLIYLVVIGATDVYDYVLTVRNIAHSSIIPSSMHLYITLVITNCDVSMLTALSIDRYVAISVDPKKLAKYSKGKIATGTCILVWIASLVVCAPIFYGIDTSSGSYDISESSFKVAMAISFVISYIIPLIVITVVYFAIRRKLRKRGGASLRVKKGDVEVMRTPEEYRLYHDQQILRGILVIILLYTFNFGARYITKMIIYLSIPFGNIAIFVATQLSEVAAILTASLQPIVYVALHPTFSQHTKEKFACSGGAKSLGCCRYCGKCYIACCTCCGLIRLLPLPQPSMRDVDDSRRSKNIDKVVLVENIELDIVPPPPSPTLRDPSPPETASSSPPSSSLPHLPNSSPPPTPSSPPRPSSPAYIPHTHSPYSSPSYYPPNPPQTSSSPPPSSPSIPPPPSSPPHSPPYPHVLFFPSPRPSSPPRSFSPPCLECEEP